MFCAKIVDLFLRSIVDFSALKRRIFCAQTSCTEFEIKKLDHNFCKIRSQDAILDKKYTIGVPGNFFF